MGTEMSTETAISLWGEIIKAQRAVQEAANKMYDLTSVLETYNKELYSDFMDKEIELQSIYKELEILKFKCQNAGIIN